MDRTPSDSPSDRIARNWRALGERVAAAAGRAGRDPAGVTVVAVTKTRSAAEVTAALAAGVTDVGENRVQEADGKRPEVVGTARWHLIGQLQRNKAARAVDLFDVIHSVDSPRLADALERRLAESGRRLEALVQVNTSGAMQQGGVAADGLPALLDHCAGLQHLRVRGLMTIAAHVPDARTDADAVRACFRQLHDLARRHAGRGIALDILSMGMSGDFEIAVEEGATMIRVGTVLFGERHSHG